MAINKQQNQNLQITIKKSDYLRLLEIKNELSQQLKIDLSKSETITYLIKSYGANQEKKAPKTTANNGVDYGVLVRALKDKMQASFTDLSVMVGIPSTTLKKYASGIQRPKSENLQLLNDALTRYGIK